MRARYVDHALAGEWSDHRDCHIRLDPLLIDRKPDADTLEPAAALDRAAWPH